MIVAGMSADSDGMRIDRPVVSVILAIDDTSRRQLTLSSEPHTLSVVDRRCEIHLIEVDVLGRATRNLECVDNTGPQRQAIHAGLTHCAADIDDDSRGGRGG
jgi:hypothetical protein